MVRRYYDFLDRRLAENEFLAGDEFTVADILGPTQSILSGRHATCFRDAEGIPRDRKPRTPFLTHTGTAAGAPRKPCTTGSPTPTAPASSEPFPNQVEPLGGSGGEEVL